MRTTKEIVTDLERLTADLAETITLQDLQSNEWLRRLVVVADDIENRVEYRALEWAKSQ